LITLFRTSTVPVGTPVWANRAAHSSLVELLRLGVLALNLNKLMTENQISKVIVDAAIEVDRELGGPGLIEEVRTLTQRRKGAETQLQAQIVIGLQACPHFRACAKVARQPQRCVRRNTALLQNDFIDPARRHAQRTRERVLRQAVRLHKLLAQYLARMYRCQFLCLHIQW
jgi:hypothetical protein